MRKMMPLLLLAALVFPEGPWVFYRDAVTGAPELRELLEAEESASAPSEKE